MSDNDLENFAKKCPFAKIKTFYRSSNENKEETIISCKEGRGQNYENPDHLLRKGYFCDPENMSECICRENVAKLNPSVIINNLY